MFECSDVNAFRVLFPQLTRLLNVLFVLQMVTHYIGHPIPEQTGHAG